MKTNWWLHYNLASENITTKSKVVKKKREKIEKIKFIAIMEETKNKPKKGGLTDDCI